MQIKKFCPYCAEALVSRKVEGRTRRYCNRCRAPFYENPTPAVCVLLCDPQDRILLVKRSVPPRSGHWCLPGGFMELGETPEETALRELFEETGIEGVIHDLWDADSNSSELYDTVVLICYRIREYIGIPVPGDDASDIDFFSAEKLPEIAFDAHVRFIEKWIKRAEENPDRHPR